MDQPSTARAGDPVTLPERVEAAMGEAEELARLVLRDFAEDESMEPVPLARQVLRAAEVDRRLLADHICLYGGADGQPHVCEIMSETAARYGVEP